MVETAGKEQVHAENNIGAQYKLGKGAPVDYIKALEWFHKSAQEGYAGAQYNLGRCMSIFLGVCQGFWASAGVI